jgi:hypothetical protein
VTKANPSAGIAGYASLFDLTYQDTYYYLISGLPKEWLAEV